MLPDTPQPRVSAVISAYNCTKFLADAIISVLNQSWPVAEIVVVDDGSTDDTAAVVQSFARDGVRYAYQKNQGSGAARNRGIQETSGEFIAFLDCDDIWLPTKTELQVNYLLAHPEMGLVGCNGWWWDLNTDEWFVQPRGLAPDKPKVQEIFVQNFVGNPSATLIRRTVLAHVGGFDPRLRWGVDWELWMRIIPQFEIGFISEPLLIYRWHRENVSHENRWERFRYLENLALRAAETEQSFRHRIKTGARVRAKTNLHRGWYLRALDKPRRQQIWYWLQSFWGYPWEDFGEKIKLLLSIILGDGRYRNLRAAPKRLMDKIDSRSSSSQNAGTATPPDLASILRYSPPSTGREAEQ